jgi:hypothetical protein
MDEGMEHFENQTYDKALVKFSIAIERAGSNEEYANAFSMRGAVCGVLGLSEETFILMAIANYKLAADYGSEIALEALSSDAHKIQYTPKKRTGRPTQEECELYYGDPRKTSQSSQASPMPIPSTPSTPTIQNPPIFSPFFGRSTPSTPSAPTIQKIQYNDGAVYEGYVLNGAPHGNGKMTYPQSIYSRVKKAYTNVEEGKWENGIFVLDTSPPAPAPSATAQSATAQAPSGYSNGRITLPDGDTYEGDLMDGIPHGKGTLTSKMSEGTIYEGDWVNGKRHGKGIIKQKKNGKVLYKGDFANGYRVN